MKNLKIFNILLFVVSMSMLLGCGSGGGGDSSGGGGGYSPVTPEQELPAEYSTAPAFNNASNVIYTHNSNSNNVAVDLPVGSTYFVAVRNTAPNSQNISLVSSVSASVRVSVADEPQASLLSGSMDSYKQQEREEAETEYRKNFINYLKQRNNSKVLPSARAGISGVDHSYEVVGQSYNIWTTDTNGTPYCLNNCKLVAETEHAKFFVDQNNRYGYSCHKELMESIVKNGDFALTKVFDSDTVNIYDVITEKFGNFHDVDNDGKVSVIITPYLSSLNSSLLGLFIHYSMLEDFIVQGVQDSRDQILIAPPINGQDSNYNRYEAVSNLCHEFQHLINFSHRFYRNGVYSFNNDDIQKFDEELYFDEGSSVCAEALFRRARGERGYFSLYDYKTGGSSSIEYTGNDTRFNDCFLSSDGCFKNVFPFYSSTENRYKNYGLNGLFLLYLHDRFGSENFKKLIQLPFTGGNNTPGNEGLKSVIPQTLGTGESLDDLQRGWHFALQHEYLLTELKKEGETLTTDVRFKYNDCLRLNSKNKSLNQGTTYLSPGYTVLYKIKPGSANTGSNFRFFIESSNSTYKNLEINIIKL